MTTLVDDVRHAIRQFLRNPGFAVVVVVVLALGVGATTAVFSIVNSVLIESLPYPETGRLVHVAETLPGGSRNTVSGGAFKDWYESSVSFSHLATYEGLRANLTGGGTPERVSGLMVSSEFLSALGVSPIIGTGFAPGDDGVGGRNRVVVLSHGCWSSRFAGDPAIIGRTVVLDQIPYTVIGILPPRALLWDDAALLIPAVIDDDPSRWARAGHWREVIGRLSPGVSIAQAEAELKGIKQRLVAEYPPFKKYWSVSVIPLQEVFAGPTRATLVMLMGAVTLVLLIACAHVSTLLLARGNARARDTAIRSALGAHPHRIIRAALAESILLALAGCGVGLLLAQFAVEGLPSLLGGPLPSSLHPRLDGNVVVFSILLACACGLLAGLLPALRASRPDLERVLKDSERGAISGSKLRSQSLMVVAEIAVTLVLLIGAGLFLRSFVKLLQRDPGFEPRQTLAFDLSLPLAKYPDPTSRRDFIDGLTDRLAVLPGVEAVGSSSSLPLSARGRSEYASRSDRPEESDYIVGIDFVGRDYIAAAGIRLLRGRTLTESDRRDDAAPVVVVDAGIARDLFPGEDPVGQSLRLLGVNREIVGVVAPIHHRSMALDPLPRVFGPAVEPSMESSIVVRTTVPALSAVEPVRATVLAADPELPLANVRTLEMAVRGSLKEERAVLTLLSLFAGLAVCLACLGTYGFISYAFGLRTRELCIRMALGAQTNGILRQVLGVGLRLTAAGTALGLLASLPLARLVESQLHEIQTHDPPVLVASSCLIGLVALISCLVPARRAAGCDIVQGLRHE
ncbi:MAG: ABC transporter permease [Acidobacteriota bacterium]|jgi:predicted permease